MSSSPTTLLRSFAKIARALSLLLLPALVAEAQAMSAPQRKVPVSPAAPASVSKRRLPYLAAIGSVPLRFSRPAAKTSDEPPSSPVHTAPDLPPEPVKSPEPLLAPIAQTEPPAVTAELPPSPEPAKNPISILPDDTRREIRPEDVIPYFLYPRADSNNGELTGQVVLPFTPALPRSSPQPASSATYERK